MFPLAALSALLILFAVVFAPGPGAALIGLSGLAALAMGAATRARGTR